MPRRGPLRVWAQPAAPHGPERRVCKDDIHSRRERGRRKCPRIATNQKSPRVANTRKYPCIAVNHRDPVGRAVVDDILRGQRSQFLLDLDGPQVTERLPVKQDQRNDPAAGADFQEVVLRPASDEVRQEGGIEGEAVTTTGLANADLPVEETGR